MRMGQQSGQRVPACRAIFCRQTWQMAGYGVGRLCLLAERAEVPDNAMGQPKDTMSKLSHYVSSQLARGGMPVTYFLSGGFFRVLGSLRL